MTPLTLTNPHSVLAALESRPQDVSEISLSTGQADGLWQKVADTARKHGIAVTTGFVDRSPRNKPREKFGRISAYSAQVMPKAYSSLSQFIITKPPTPDTYPLFLVLDCLQDPHNVGAIFRTAAFFNVSGIIVTKDRSAPLTHVVYDVASGGMEVVPFTVVTNLSRALEELRKADIWTLGTSEHAPLSYNEIKKDRSWALIIGNEETGIRRLTKDLCDEVCAIPTTSKVGSLNASVAAGILIARFAPSTPAG